MHDSFEDVKVGDVVLVQLDRNSHPLLVERVTPQQFITTGRYRFWKNDGRGVDGSLALFRHRAYKATPAMIAEAKAKMKQSVLIESIKRRNLRALNLEQLQRLAAIFNE